MPDFLMSDLWFALTIQYLILLLSYFLISTFFINTSANQHINYLLYSVLKLFTGLARAALIAWKLTVNTVIPNAPAPVAINIHQDICV